MASVTNENPSIDDEERKMKITNAESWKQEGNEYFKQGKEGYDNALRLYKRAIDIKCDDNKLNASLHGNIAAVYFSMQKYPECVDSCRVSLTIDPNNVKIWSRAARSSVSLELYAQAIELCDRGLMLDPKNEDLLSIKQTSTTKLEYLRQKRQTEQNESIPLIQFEAEEAEELQSEINILTRQLNNADGEVNVAKKNISRGELVTREINEILNESKQCDIYQQYGKAFFMSSFDDIKRIVENDKVSANEQLPKLIVNKNNIEKKKLEKEKRLKGMVLDLQERQKRGEKIDYKIERE